MYYAYIHLSTFVWIFNLYVNEVFFELCTFVILTSTLVLGINYFVIITRPLHPIQVRKRSSSSCYMIETYNIIDEIMIDFEKVWNGVSLVDHPSNAPSIPPSGLLLVSKILG